MRTIKLAAKTPQEWAKTGENNATALTLDVTAELALWPTGEPQATYYRPDGVVYPIPCTISGATVSVPLTSTETTTAGRAQIEIQWIDTGVLAKSATFSGNIMQSLSEPGDVPADPGQAWLDAVTAVGVAAGEARDEAQGYAAAMDTAIADAIAPVTSQLAETGNRIDNIIATPIELPEIYVDEIHDARQGKGSIGANITEVKAQLAAIRAAGTASPAGTYADLAALIAADPDHSKIYITLDDGNWCYWNGTVFVAGGVYQAAQIADGSITPTKMYQGTAVGNLYSTRVSETTGKFASVIDGVLAEQVSADFRYFIMAVEPNTLYICTHYRFLVLLEADMSTAIGTHTENNTTFNSGSAAYVAVSYNHVAYSPTTYAISVGPTLSTSLVYNVPWVGVNGANIQAGTIQPLSLNGASRGNLFPTAELFAENRYTTIISGHLATAVEESFNVYILPIEAAVYVFTNIRFALLLAADKYTAIGDLLQNITSIDNTTAGAAYVAFSFNKTTYPIADYIVSKGTVLIPDDYVMPDWIGIPALSEQLEKAFTAKDLHSSISGDLAAGGTLVLTSDNANLRKGERITFTGNFSSFGGLEIGLRFSASAGAYSNRVVIDDTNVTIYRLTTQTAQHTHGLTFTNNITVIMEQQEDASLSLTIISNGVVFLQEEIAYTKGAIGYPFVISTNAMTGCKLSYTCTDLCKKIWAFGDSYLAYSTERWTYYLNQYGYSVNTLLDGYPGEGSVNAKNGLISHLRHATPKYVLWCVGMNDGSDSGAPAGNWVTHRDTMLSYCTALSITPVFGTIPTVPSVNNEYKNAWIRASGYRYVDFAAAVGAQSDGTWFDGMLGGDSVHPTEAGAEALFSRVLVDFPEIMLSR